jgi:hypothetical protein
VLKAATRLTAVGTLRNPVAQSVRNLVGHVMLGLAPVQQAFADTMTEVSIGYPASPLNGPSLRGVPAPGERVVPAADQIPAGAGGAPLFALFAERTPAVADLLRQLGGLLDREVRRPVREGAILLVRPDGYAACAADRPAVIAGYLEGLQRSVGPVGRPA